MFVMEGTVAVQLVVFVTLLECQAVEAVVQYKDFGETPVTIGKSVAVGIRAGLGSDVCSTPFPFLGNVLGVFGTGANVAVYFHTVEETSRVVISNPFFRDFPGINSNGFTGLLYMSGRIRVFGRDLTNLQVGGLFSPESSQEALRLKLSGTIDLAIFTSTITAQLALSDDRVAVMVRKNVSFFNLIRVRGDMTVALKSPPQILVTFGAQVCLNIFNAWRCTTGSPFFLDVSPASVRICGPWPIIGYRCYSTPEASASSEINPNGEIESSKVTILEEFDGPGSTTARYLDVSTMTYTTKAAYEAQFSL